MNTCPGRCLQRRQVNNKVADLTEEIILVGVPISSSAVVRVGVNDCNALEGCSRFDCGKGNRVSDKLSVV